MNDDRADWSKYVWVGMVVVFLLVFGGVWMVLAPREAPKQDEPAAAADVQEYGPYDQYYASRVPAQPQMPPAPVYGGTAESPSVVVTPLMPRPAERRSPKTATQAPARAGSQSKKMTLRDMFPMGNIMRNVPRTSRLREQVAESYPAFEYHGQMWSATGSYVLSGQADLVPTGQRLDSGQAVYSLNDSGVSDGVLFVQSRADPGKFAVYRAG